MWHIRHARCLGCHGMVKSQRVALLIEDSHETKIELVFKQKTADENGNGLCGLEVGTQT